MSEFKTIKVYCKAFTDLLLRFADGSNITIAGMNSAESGKDHAITEAREDKIQAWLDAHADSDLVRNGHIGIHTGEDPDGTEQAEAPPEPAASTIPAPSTSDGTTGKANPPPKDAATKPADEMGDDKPKDSDKASDDAAQKEVDAQADRIEAALADK